MENQENKLLSYALNYLSKGWSVIPINPATKSPYLDTWEEFQRKLATKEEIIHWWTSWPNAAIGVVTGEISGFDAVDVDPRHGGTTDELTPTIHYKTGGGGWHLLYRHTPGLHCKNGLKPGVDFKTTGGYVIFPPSPHKSGNYYEWIVSPDDADFAELPMWIIEIFKKQPKKVTLKESINISEGSRHNKLLSLADSLLSRKYIPNEIWLTLNEINSTYQEPLKLDELTQIFQDACQFIGSQQQIQQNSTIVIPNALEFLKQEFGDTDWLVEDLIPAGGSAIIVAKRESFKTWLALYLAYRISQGLPLWDKFPTHKNKVIYISNDDPTRRFQNRIDKFSFDDAFFVYHQGLPDFSIEQNNGSFESVKKLVTEEKIGLVVVDILRNTNDKDSNTDKDSKLVLGKYKELREGNPNLVLIYLIHPSKEQQLEKRFGKRQSEEAVGSYYWEAAVDTVLSLTKTTEDDTDQVVITVTKNKQSEKKIKPFIGIQRKGEGEVEFIYEEKIPDTLKVAQAKEYIRKLLSERDYTRQQLIDLAVADKICGGRTVEEALKELNDEAQVTHTKSKPHVYSLVKEQPIEDSANRKTNNELRNAESVTQPELISMEETENDHS